MKKLWLVIWASVREQLRWAGQHLYTLLILTPLIAGISYATVGRLAEEAPAWQPSLEVSLLLTSAFVFSLIGLSLTRASTEIYHLRRPESVLDALPVSFSTHLNAALLKRVTRTALLGLFVLILRKLLGEGRVFELSLLATLAVFILLIALAEVLAALGWIHWGHTKKGLVGFCVMLTGVVSAMLSGALLVWLLRPFVFAAQSLRLLVMCSAVWCVALYLLTIVLHGRWRAADIEYAKRLQASSSNVGARAASYLQRKFERAVAAQLARDLQLTFRAFSSAVYVALFICALWVAALLAVLITGLLPESGQAGWIEATWLPPVIAVKAACVLVSATSAMLVSVLVAYQLPYFWLERATGATGRQMWETKLWYARIVSLHAPLVVWIVGVLTGTIPLFYALPLLAECVWLWWLVSTLIGALAFEVPDRPELAIVLMISSGVMVGLFISAFWPVGFVLYAMNIVRGITERGHARAKYCLLTEED